MSLSVNSNYSTLSAANNLSRTVGRITDTMRQLSTGVAVTPKSDPAAFIAGTLMESDIRAANQAVRNSQLSNAVLSIAESGMSQISNLLQEADVLSVALANEGALTPEMVNAYQTQLDGVLGSIDRIAKTTNYMGVPLLDGSYTAKTAQLGTDVVSSQQVQVSIPNMGTTGLGTSEGILANLSSNGTTPLASNTALGNSIINGALSQILTSRGEIGSLQKYTLDSSINFMQDYMTELSGAKSTIMDTDFALAASNLARDSILMQTGVSALGLSTINAQYAASLLQ